MARQKLKVTLETVTPLFLGGADGKTPELRPASFRGAMRFWLRALLGGVLGDDVEAVRREEAKVFGSTEGASPVVVRTADQNESLECKPRRVLPHSEERRKQFTPPAFIEGSQFTLVLSPRPGQQLPAPALAALLLTLNLGGVGKRSRRGFGNLQAIKAQVDGLNLPGDVESLLEEQPENGQALVQHLTKVVGTARSLVNVSGGLPYALDALPDYPILSSDHALVLVCQHAFSSYEQAMVDFWRKVLRQPPFRDCDEFGYAKSIEVVRNGKRQKKQIRRASPLILHIWRTRASYHLVLTAFKSHLSHDPDYDRSGDWALVEKLLKECEGRWDGEYVFGKGG